MSAYAGMAKPIRDADSEMRTPDDDPLAAFHSGSRPALTAAYRDNFAAVDRAVGRILSGADKETVVHEVFFRILTSPELRAGFRGGSMGAWLATISRNHAIDFARRRQRELPAATDAEPHDAMQDGSAMEQRTDARIVIERFRRDHLPPQWDALFELRFLQHLDQQQAARALGIGRTTLAYREYRIRSMLRRFLLHMERA